MVTEKLARFVVETPLEKIPASVLDGARAALIDTIGGSFDGVIDRSLLERPLQPGNVVTGWFWLSGRLRTGSGRRGGWFSRLTGRR